MRPRKPRPLRLADLDPQLTAEKLVRNMYARVQRDSFRLGLALKVEQVPEGEVPKKAMLVVMQSRAFETARMCLDWATAGRGNPTDVAAALRALHADLDGVEAGEPARGPDMSTAAGLVVVAVEARLALAEGRTVEAVEVATLASVDERTIRAVAEAGALPSVGTGRPMRFAADVVRQYLYARGVPGFGGTPGPTPAAP